MSILPIKTRKEIRKVFIVALVTRIGNGANRTALIVFHHITVIYIKLRKARVTTPSGEIQVRSTNFFLMTV